MTSGAYPAPRRDLKRPCYRDDTGAPGRPGRRLVFASMGDPLKTFFSPALVRRLAADLTKVHPAFPGRRFVKAACAGLDDLELLDRGRHIARALAAHLPPSYPEAVDVLLRSLGPEHANDELLGVGMAPFFYLPHTLFVAERGLDHFELSMRAQYELTKRFSAEASIRPYIARDPARVMAVLRDWARDGNAHVRRLVSEGTRLRLPWAPRVSWLDEHPERGARAPRAAEGRPLDDGPAERGEQPQRPGEGASRSARSAPAHAWLEGASAERRATRRARAAERRETGRCRSAPARSAMAPKPSISRRGRRFPPAAGADRRPRGHDVRSAQQIDHAAGPARRRGRALRESAGRDGRQGLQGHPPDARASRIARSSPPGSRWPCTPPAYPDPACTPWTSSSTDMSREPGRSRSSARRQVRAGADVPVKPLGRTRGWPAPGALSRRTARRAPWFVTIRLRPRSSMAPYALEFLAGGGRVGALMRAHDWSTSPLGAPEQWPQSLRTVVALLLQSRFPMFVAWGVELGFLYNDPYADILGAKHPRALGRRFHDIWSEIWADISPLIDAAMAGQAVYREDLPLVMNRKGYDEQTWFTFSYSPVRDEHGTVAGMFCVVSETTQKVLAERALRESEGRLRALVAASSYALYRMSPDWSQMLSLEGQGFIPDARHPTGAWFGAYILPEDQSSITAAIQKAIATRSVFELEHRVRRVDGTTGWTLSKAVPLLDANGNISEWFGAASDVTARKNAEAALRELNETLERRVNDALASRKVLADIVEGTDAFVQVSDLNYRWLAINRAAVDEFERIFGVRPKTGDNMLELLADRPEPSTGRQGHLGPRPRRRGIHGNR